MLEFIPIAAAQMDEYLQNIRNKNCEIIIRLIENKWGSRVSVDRNVFFFFTGVSKNEYQ